MEQDLLQGIRQHKRPESGLLPRDTRICSLHLDQHVLGRWDAPHLFPLLESVPGNLTICHSSDCSASDPCEVVTNLCTGLASAGLKLKFASASREAFESTESKDCEQVPSPVIDTHAFVQEAHATCNYSAQ